MCEHQRDLLAQFVDSIPIDINATHINVHFFILHSQFLHTFHIKEDNVSGTSGLHSFSYDFLETRCAGGEWPVVSVNVAKEVGKDFPGDADNVGLINGD